MVFGNLKNENTPTLYTDRLILRKFELKDLEDTFLLYNDKEVNRFLPWFPHQTKEETKKYLQDVVFKVYEKPLAYFYAIAMKENNLVIGQVTINDIDSESGASELGYALKKSFWNRGIVTEACLGIIKHLKNSGLKYLTATHDVNNVGSGKVMKKIGMKYCYSYEEQVQPKDMTVIFRMYQINLDGNLDRVYKGYWNKNPNHFIENISD